MSDTYEQAGAAAREFIRSAGINDKPRLENEIYPDSVTVIRDIVYTGSGDDELCFDWYLPEGQIEDDIGGKAFLLIHGGAFVYGSKILDKCYGMHLAEKSGLPVANIDYHLLPGNTMRGILGEILCAVSYISDNYGVRDFHLTGDSAGGYLALITSLLLRNPELRAELGFNADMDVTSSSVGLICGLYTLNKKSFPGIFFEKDSSEEETLPDYMYDLRTLIKRFGSAPSVIVTGDMDFLKEDNIGLRDLFESLGIPYKFYCGVSDDSRQMGHVYPIAEPAWEESATCIGMIADNANS